MRHRVYGKKLGRNKDERDTLFKSLVRSLFTYGTIQTSETKAKAIKGLVDKVINLAKEKNEQRLQSFLIDKNLRERLIKEIVPKVGNRSSGYTSLVKLGTRLGDQTMMVKMSLIGVEELEPVKVEVSKETKVSKVSKVKSVSKSSKEKVEKQKINNRKPMKRVAKRIKK
ncbi:50S ribosomal protein L17 [Candidatus Daviesbacteria bacterium]|nr:50S ribosomal protein L17 [Candidatus Daviesbacteria bacterium]